MTYSFSHRFNVYFNDSNISTICSDVTQDSVEITQATDEALYISSVNPIKTFYIDLKTPSEDTANIDISVVTSSGWVKLDDFLILDKTNNFKRSGFISINTKDISQIQDDINNLNGYHIKLTFDASIEYELNAVTVIFADDNDLKKEYFLIDSPEFLFGASSHLLIHVAVRDEIIQRFNNMGVNLGTGLLTVFDLAEIYEVRQAGLCLALAKIFMNVSDNPKDSWYMKSLEYSKKGENFLRLAYLSLSQGDTVIKSDITVGRLYR